MKKTKLILLVLMMVAAMLSMTACKKEMQPSQEGDPGVLAPVEEEPLEPVDENILMPEAGLL